MKHVCKCGNDDRNGGWCSPDGTFTCIDCINKRAPGKDVGELNHWK